LNPFLASQKSITTGDRSEAKGLHRCCSKRCWVLAHMELCAHRKCSHEDENWRSMSSDTGIYL